MSVINTQEHIKQMMQETKSIIDECGFMVFGTSEFCYTAGLSKRGLPEIVISSQDPRMCHWLISLLVDEWCRNGYQDGRFDDLLCYDNDAEQDIPMAVHPITFNDKLHANYVTQTINFYNQYPEYIGKGGIKFVQAFWPDNGGRLPFEDDYNTKYAQEDIAKATQNTLKVH